MVQPADSPVTAVMVERAGDQHQIHLVHGDGRIEVVQAAKVRGGLRTPGDVLAELVRRGVPLDDAEHCVREVHPAFTAQAELDRRPDLRAAADQEALKAGRRR